MPLQIRNLATLTLLGLCLWSGNLRLFAFPRAETPAEWEERGSTVEKFVKLMHEDSVARAEKDTVRLLRVLNNLGKLYYENALNQEALSYYHEGLKISQQRQDGESKVLFLNNLGLNYMLLGNKGHEEALQYFTAARSASPNTRLRFNILYNMGYLHQQLGDTGSAIADYSAAIAIADSMGSPVLALSVRLNRMALLANQEDLTKEFLSAKETYFALKGPLEGGRFLMLSNNLIHYAMELGRGEEALVIAQFAEQKLANLELSLEHRYRFAKVYLEVIETYGKQNETMGLLKDRLVLLADSLVEHQGKQTLLAQKKKAEIQQMANQLAYQEKELALQHQVLEESLVKRRLLLVSGGVLFFILVLALWLFFEKNKSKDLKQKQLELEKELLVKEKNKVAQSLEAQNLVILQKRKLVEEAVNLLKGLDKDVDLKTTRRIHSAIAEMRSNLKNENEYELVKESMNERSQERVQVLHEAHPNLTDKDLRLASFLLLKLDTTETAKLLKINKQSLNTARYRLRKKMNLAPEQDLIEYLEQCHVEKTHQT